MAFALLSLVPTMLVEPLTDLHGHDPRALVRSDQPFRKIVLGVRERLIRCNHTDKVRSSHQRGRDELSRKEIIHDNVPFISLRDRILCASIPSQGVTCRPIEGTDRILDG